MKYSYRWLNILTGKRGSGVVECANYNKFCRLLASWNRQGFGVWQYAEEPKT